MLERGGKSAGNRLIRNEGGIGKFDEGSKRVRDLTTNAQRRAACRDRSQSFAAVAISNR